MDGSHAFDFPLGDLSPGQHGALDAALDREHIQHQWLGSTLQVDVAFEPRVSTLVDQARGGVLPAAPTPAGPLPPGRPMAGTVMPGPVPAPAPAPYYGGPAPTPAPGSPYGAYPTPGYGPGPGYPTRTNGLAVAALVLALAGLACWLVATIPAVICGHIARRQIRDSNGEQEGDGLALAGLIIGWIINGLTIALFVFWLVIVVIAIASGPSLTTTTTLR